MTELVLTPTLDYRPMSRPADTNENRDLGWLVRMYENKNLLLPEHQREFCWPLRKQRSYVDRLWDSLHGSKSQAPGVYLLYKIATDDWRALWLNDGRQRAETLVRLKTQPDLYGRTKDEVAKLLTEATVTVQVRGYENHEEAARDFHHINSGEGLTANELNSWKLCYRVPGWNHTYAPAIERLNETLESCASTWCKRWPDKASQHWLARNTYVLIALWFKIRADMKSKATTTVEDRLAERFGSISANDALRQLADLSSYVRLRTPLLRDAWLARYPGRDTLLLSQRLLRWFLAVQIWHRDEIPDSWWEHFALALVARLERGKARVSFADGTSANVASNWQQFQMIAKRLGCEGGIPIKQKRRSGRSDLPPGYDRSHIKPFIAFGDGPTVCEAAIVNRARGAKEIE